MVYGVWFIWGVLGDAGLGAAFLGWLAGLGDARNMVVWRMIPHCVMWCLWRERNARHFKDCEKSVEDLKLMFFHTLYEWVYSLGLFSINSIMELIDLCCF